jgi:branched-chain amino acid transport system permease protein
MRPGLEAVRRAALDVIPTAAFLLVAGYSLVWMLGRGEELFIIMLFINLTLVLGLQIFVGNTGIVSFGHGAIIAVAAYVSGLLTVTVQLKAVALPKLPEFLAKAHTSFIEAIVITILVVVPAAAIIGVPLARLSGAAASIATFALLVITQGVLIGLGDYTRGTQTFYGLPSVVTLTTAIMWAIGALFVARLFANSRAGLMLRSSADDELAASAIGIKVRRLRILAWAVSCGVTAVGGVLLAHTLTAFSPNAFYLTLTIGLLTMLIVGGARTTTGAVIGTLGVTAVLEVLRRIENGVDVAGLQFPTVFGLQTLGLGACLIVAMILRPQGLVRNSEPDLSVEALGRWLRTTTAIVAQKARRPSKG